METNKFVRKFVQGGNINNMSIKRIKEVDLSEEQESSEEFNPKQWKEKMI